MEQVIVTDEQVNPTEKANVPDQGRNIALAFMAGIVIAVLTLEYYGFIRHSNEADAAVVEEFALLDLSPEVDVKVSEKDSGKLAFCSDGYLLLRPDNGKSVVGILVDSKKRAIHCKSQLKNQ
jgi:hypothetical protein